MRRKTDAKYRARVHICALDTEICQVRKDRELGKEFFHFAKKIIDAKSFAKPLPPSLILLFLGENFVYKYCYFY